MASKTFSSRVDEEALNYADMLSRQEYGLSFGQYCGTILIDSIRKSGRMPSLPTTNAGGNKKAQAISFIKNFSASTTHPEIGEYSDKEIRDLIASKYE